MSNRKFKYITAAVAAMTAISAGMAVSGAFAANDAYGDANCDGNVAIADAVAILQYLANGSKYPLSEQGKINGDVFERGGGITAKDALSIQKYDAGSLNELPESWLNGEMPVQTAPQQTTMAPVTTAPIQTSAPVIQTTEAPVTTVTENNNQNSGIKDFGTPMNSNATMVADFRKGATPEFFASDGWTNGKPFDCWWYKENTSLSNGVLELTVDKERNANDKNPDWDPAYSGAEYRTENFYGYGYYETSMQAIKNDGIVSSFFTYTGPSDNNPWDEIDIEILGKDTTKVQLNYYTNGQGGHEYMYDLGFDASEGYHTYGFDWQPDHITWYVDGKEAYTMRGDLPKTEGKIMMNTWPGRTVDEWLKAYDGKTPLTARYQWVTYDKNGKNGNSQQPVQTAPQQTTVQTTIQTTKTTVATTVAVQMTTVQASSGNQYAGFTDFGSPMNSNASMVADFRKGATPLFFASEGWENGDPFDCGWYENQTSLNNGVLSLSIDKDYSGKYNYAGAEYRTADHYGYGYYETSMQAIKNNGVVSSFFTYTGPSEDNPWDEIDVEVLGKDTTKVQFNYYTNGQGNHEYMYDLGFDASQGYHTYGFDWQPDHITWYVDGKPVYTANQNIPSTPGRIMMNTWPGRGVDEWLAHYDGKTPLTARYLWVTYDNKGGNNTPVQTNPPQTTPSNPTTTTPSGNGLNKNATMADDFTDGKADFMFASDGWTNGDMFDCYWIKENAVLRDGTLQLSIGSYNQNNFRYSGGEYRSKDFYGFGYYETSMKPIKNSGVVSSFFTYTGPTDNNPWDEIDIEFLGKDTTKVQFNYFTNGHGDHEYLCDLGFDASQGFHTYGFDWQRDHITWYVDGKPVHTAYQNIPQTPGKLMMNTWPGTGVDNWLGHFDGKTPLTAYYQWVSYDKNGKK